MRTWSLICSIAMHLLLVLAILGVSAWVKPQRQPELIPLDLELIDAPAAAVAPPENQPDTKPQEPEPPPPKEEAPEPEPPAKEPEPPPKEPEPAVVEPPKAEKPDPPKVEKPDPPKEKKLSREEQMRQRMEEARKTSRTVKPTQTQTPKTDNSKAIARTLDNFAKGSKSVTLPSASTVAGVSAAQMNNYQSYMARCVSPMLNALWQTHGPDGLDGGISPVVIDFYVAPSGAVQSCVISSSSGNSQMNAAAQALIRELTRKGLPPFSTVGLSTERNASIPIRFTLKYTR